MNRSPLLLFLILFYFSHLQAETSKAVSIIGGKILDKESNEPLTGATIVLRGTNYYAISGLDGSFQIRNIAYGTYAMDVSFVSYAPQSIDIEVDGPVNLNIAMESAAISLGTVVVTTTRIGHTEASARATERNAPNVMNVIAARTIELSPDITVANVAQRVSGVSLERSPTGDGQHTIVRGMDKRYNYTLVNGVKIPSPDNNNRYVPLDIFPSELLERLEVTKSLTPDMEADAIGGVVDMKLKDAPEETVLNFNIATGMNTLFLERDFATFDHASVSMNSPKIKNGNDYQSNVDDFPLGVVNHKTVDNMPLNQLYGLTAGRRFGHRNRFGVITAFSHQNTVRGSESDFFHFSTDRESNLPVLDNAITADRSTRQIRTGAHAKMDYRLSEDHNLSFYSSYMRLAEQETRVMVDTALQLARSGPGTGRIEKWIRTRQRISNIYTNNLQGVHKFNDLFSLDGSAVFSKATYDDPDMAEFMTISERRLNEDGTFRQTDWVYDNTNHRGFFRRWMGNSDQDIAGYLNLYFTPDVLGQEVLIKTGGMYRNKQRENYFDRYRLGTSPTYQIYGGDITDNTFNVVIKWTHMEYFGGRMRGPSTVFDEGETIYGFYTEDENTVLIIEDSWFRYFLDDAIRPEGAKIAILRNTFEGIGGVEGEALNAKSGTVGVFAYNMIIGLATNGPKTGSGGGLPTQTIIDVYNNTIVGGGFRRVAPGRGGSMNVERGAGGYWYNNAVINCRYGMRVVNDADYTKTFIGHTHYYGHGTFDDNEGPLSDNFYPENGTIGGDFPDEHIVNDNLDNEDPMFANYVADQFTQDDYRNVHENSAVTPFNLNFVMDQDFRLQPDSPLVGAGSDSAFTPTASITEVGTRALSYPIPPPSVDIGAFPTAGFNNGIGNRHLVRDYYAD